MHFAPMQQRRSIRRAVSIPCTLMRAQDLKVVGTRSMDLSPDGILVGVFDEMKVGEDMIMSFSLTPFSIPFHVEGRVARFLRGQRQRDRMPAAAMSFDSLDAVGRLILRGHLRRIPPVLPQRTRRIDYAATVMRILHGEA